MSNDLKLFESEESARSLDRMDGSENQRDDLPIIGILLNLQKLFVEPIEVFVTLD
ncbi:MAG: hypothetical protein AAB263_00560 [Planctomycetota bacterium]